MKRDANIKKNVSLKDYLLFVEAWYFLAIAGFTITLFPFRIIVTILKKETNSTFSTEASKETLKGISLSINRACARSFWRTKCFEQAFAAKMMLNRRKLKSTIYFGVTTDDKNNKSFLAHAWLKSGERIITGGENNKKFNVINSF